MSLATSAPPIGADDVLTLTVGNSTLTGWQRVAVTRPLAGIPASFSLEVTEKYPDAPDVDVQAGAPCTVKIGGDLVLTGYVDRYAAELQAGNHTIRVEGRSKSEDLVDCSALVGDVSKPGMQVVNGTTLSIAQKLAAPYHVTIQSTAGDGVTVPQFNINLGETVWEIVDRVTRYSKMLAYDMPDGSVMLAKVGTEKMASGFTTGQNIEQASISFSMDQRFSQYEAHMISTMALGTDAGVNTPGVGKIVTDDKVPRFRKRYVVSEQFVMGESIAYDRAVWERNRRYGQSQQFSVTCDAWRDVSGRLWSPNYLAPINAPQLKLPSASWIIASVTYIRDEAGQHAALVLMPPEAFAAEPVALNALTTVDDVSKFNAAKTEQT